ncbi:MAG: 30S ribosomal protein S7 [Candidatus Hodarchaeota archaeon]
MGKKKKSTEEEQPEVEEVVETSESSSPETEAPEKPTKEDEILIFGKWSSDVELRDKGLERYLNVREVSVPHYSGVYSKKRFWKSKYNIVERLCNRLMTPGIIKSRVKGRKTSYRSGKKQKVLNIIRRSFDLLHLKTGANPVQLLVQAVENSAPREDTTRISMGGISYQSSVDVAPQRRLDMAVHFLALGASKRTYNNPLTVEECLADEILAASKGAQGSFAISKKEEKERIAFSAR